MTYSIKAAPQTSHSSVAPQPVMIAPKPAMAFFPHKTAANDQLFKELEMRYGCGFAQWVIDGL